MTQWLEAHQGLSGWAQFVGAMLAMLLTYFTAFAPIWHRKKQLRIAAARLLSNGYEAIESYHYTSANFLPEAVSVRFAAMTVMNLANEIDSFPTYELHDQGPKSLARYLVAMVANMRGLHLYYENILDNIEGRAMTIEERDAMREFLNDRLTQIKDMLSGKDLKRPTWPVAPEGTP